MKKILFTTLSLLFVAVVAYGQLKIATPVLEAPNDEVTDQMPNVILNWSSVINATGYHVILATDANFTNPIVDMTGPLSAYQCESLFFNTSYFWKVRSIKGEEFSDWTEARSFTTFSAMILDDPGDGDDGEEAEIQFEWKDKVGGNKLAGLTFYQLQVDTSSTIFNNNVVDPFWNITFPFVTNIKRHILSQVFYGETMYWRMRAMHAQDTCDWSEVWSFETDNQIELDKPNNGTTNAGLSEFIEWDEFDGTPDFEYQVHLNSSFAGAITYFVDSTEVPAPQLSYGNTYYWRVRGKNMVDTTAWSEVWNFETAGAVTLSEPMNMMDSTTLNPVLKWEQITGSNAYNIQYTTDSTFTELKEDIYIGASNSISNPAFNITFALDKGETYFWRVRACMESDTSDYSPAWRFTTTPPVGINEYLSSKSIGLYPNPANSQTTLSLSVEKAISVNYSLVDITGKEMESGVLNLNVGQNSHTFGVSDFPKGIYFISLTNEGSTISRKLIVK